MNQNSLSISLLHRFLDQSRGYLGLASSQSKSQPAGERRSAGRPAVS